MSGFRGWSGSVGVCLAC